MATVRTIEAQLAAYEGDMRRDFKYHLSHVDNVLYAMAERGDNFFDETIRLQRIFDLMNADRMRGHVRARGRGRHRRPGRSRTRAS